MLLQHDGDLDFRSALQQRATTTNKLRNYSASACERHADEIHRPMADNEMYDAIITGRKLLPFLHKFASWTLYTSPWLVYCA